MDTRGNFNSIGRDDRQKIDERQYSTSPIRQRDIDDGLASFNTLGRKGLVEPSKHSDYFGSEEHPNQP
jgi:hypothetical protein